MKDIAYLYPYVFIDSVKNGVILINSLDGKVKIYENKDIVSFLNKLKENNYVKILTEEESLNIHISNVLIELKEDFFGNRVELNKEPVIFPPYPRLLGSNENNIDNIGKDETGENLLDYTHQVDIHLSTINDDFKYIDAFKQIDFPVLSKQTKILDVDKVVKIITQFKSVGMQLRFLIGDSLNDSYLEQLVSYLIDNNRKATFLFKQNQFDYKILLNKLNKDNFFNIEIWVDNYKDYEFFETINVSGNNIKLLALISNEEEFNQLAAIEEQLDNLAIDYVPFVTEDNYSFIEDNVFTDVEDIVNQPNEMLEIQQKYVLNPLNFGRIIILTNGDTYSNTNFSCLGNIENNFMGEMIIKEFTEIKSWMKTRMEVSPCKDCYYRLLCPPITNYENYLNKFDFCNILNQKTEDAKEILDNIFAKS